MSSARETLKRLREARVFHLQAPTRFQDTESIIQAALDEAREAGRRDERERAASFANAAARAIREGEAPLRAADDETTVGFPVTDEEIDAFEAEHGPFPPEDEATVERLTDRVMARLEAKPEPLYTFTADGSKGSPLPPGFEEACKRGDVFARSDDRDIASIPLVNQLAKPAPCSTCRGEPFFEGLHKDGSRCSREGERQRQSCTRAHRMRKCPACSEVTDAE